MPAPLASATSAGEPEGQEVLNAGIQKLRGSHVMHLHRSQLALLQACLPVLPLPACQILKCICTHT